MSRVSLTVRAGYRGGAGALALIIFCNPGAAAAQDTPITAPRIPTPPTMPRPQEFPPTPFVQTEARLNPADLARLATVFGRGHYLNSICRDPDDSKWLGYMERLLQLESEAAPDDPLRLRLAAAFNDGYSGARGEYEGCDARAQRRLTEAESDAFNLSARFSRRVLGGGG